MKRTYKIQVIRTYVVLDVINVEVESSNEAEILAEEESNNKDYTGLLKLDGVETTVI